MSWGDKASLSTEDVWSRSIYCSPVHQEEFKMTTVQQINVTSSKSYVQRCWENVQPSLWQVWLENIIFAWEVFVPKPHQTRLCDNIRVFTGPWFRNVYANVYSTGFRLGHVKREQRTTTRHFVGYLVHCTAVWTQEDKVASGVPRLSQCGQGESFRVSKYEWSSNLFL